MLTLLMNIVEILRLSHRIHRDIRISSHISLTCRAFNCNKMFYSGQKDSSLENTLTEINKKFGSNFKVEYTKNPEKLIEEKKKDNYKIIHLTMYGIPVKNKINDIRKNKNILIIIGSEHVPGVYYKISDFNISITNQPISELSALTIFLHEYFQGKQLETEFKNAKLKIIPSEKGKKIKKG